MAGPKGVLKTGISGGQTGSQGNVGVQGQSVCRRRHP